MDDESTSLSISNAAEVTESPGSIATTFKVSLSRSLATQVSVDWRTLDGDGDNPAKGGGLPVNEKDFQPVTLTTLNFAPGETEKSVTVTVLDDSVAENTEIFRVALENASGATIQRGTAYGRIADDDSIIYEIVNAGTEVWEGKPLVVRVRRNRIADKEHFFRFCLRRENSPDRSGGTAVISNHRTSPSTLHPRNALKDDVRIVNRRSNTNDCMIVTEADHKRAPGGWMMAQLFWLREEQAEPFRSFFLKE